MKEKPDIRASKRYGDAYLGGFSPLATGKQHEGDGVALEFFDGVAHCARGLHIPKGA